MLHKKLKALIPACACLALLAACSSPNMFPDGYVHHNKPYKSQDPRTSPKFTEPQRRTMGPEQADQIRLAIYQLAERLTQRAGMPPKPVYVLKPKYMSPLYMNVDNDLRESLRHIGYRLSDSPEGAYVFAYKAYVLEDSRGKVASASPDQGPNLRVGLYVFDSVGDESRMLTQEEGDFFVRGAEAMDASHIGFDGIFWREPTIRNGEILN